MVLICLLVSRMGRLVGPLGPCWITLTHKMAKKQKSNEYSYRKFLKRFPHSLINSNCFTYWNFIYL